MDILEKMHQVLKDAGTSKITKSAYDTAWVARLGELDQALSNQSLNWLAENQLADGSWGASAPLSYHDRIICTLGAMVALTRHGRRGQDRRQIERGQHALDKLTKNATRYLMSDFVGATMGFELLMPNLLTEVVSHDILPHQDNNILGRFTRQRRVKVAKFPEHGINRTTSGAFLAEMVGQYHLPLLDIEHLQEANGSVACSPSATAFFALYVHPDSAALAFLNQVAVNGGVPYCAPIDVFEHAAILHNLSLVNHLSKETYNLCQPSIEFLEKHWHHEDGSSFNASLTIKDGSTTGLVYGVLQYFERTVTQSTLSHYEESGHFRYFDGETYASIIANSHILGALFKSGCDIDHPSIQKILLFLEQARTGRPFWFDKWHTSPYYATSAIIIACAGYENRLINVAVEWILNTQNEDGSWGFYSPSTEETAYCLQALVIWKQKGSTDIDVPTDILKLGAMWLTEHLDDPYPWLWIGKSLYCPELVVESTILSALMLVEQL
jgi:halimadienyl-diphosphate synthase